MPRTGEVMFDVKQEPGHILIKILDAGFGISHQPPGSVHAPFFPSKTYGAALGLTIVHRIVMNPNGEIKIQSQDGKRKKVGRCFPVKR